MSGVCKADGCKKVVRSSGAVWCDAHYMRMYRYGRLETARELNIKKRGYSREPRVVLPGAGYIRLYLPEHPLRDSQGYVSEHRKVLFDDIGPADMQCELCQKPLSWKTCHVDHIDENVQNNERKNLRPLCMVCNTQRNLPPAWTYEKNMALEFEGKTDTPTGWARDPRVSVSGTTIRRRKRAGWTDKEALFWEKITHNGRTPQKKPRPPSSSRKNAINLTIDGVTMTAEEWSRDPRCSITAGAICQRVKKGMRHEDCVFKPRKSVTNTAQWCAK